MGVGYDADIIPPRTVDINNCQFVQPLIFSKFTSIDMNWFTASQLATGTCAVITLDQVFVTKYDG